MISHRGPQPQPASKSPETSPTQLITGLSETGSRKETPRPPPIPQSPQRGAQAPGARTLRPDPTAHTYSEEWREEAEQTEERVWRAEDARGPSGSPHARAAWDRSAPLSADVPPCLPLPRATACSAPSPSRSGSAPRPRPGPGHWGILPWPPPPRAAVTPPHSQPPPGYL